MSSFHLLRALALVVFLFALPHAAKAEEFARPKITDLVLITIDALRADHMGAYGYSRKMTPNLDALAYRSVRFERVYTPTPHTSLAIGSMLTGRTLYSSIRLTPERIYATLPEMLRGAGFHTAAFFPPAVFFQENSRFKRYEDNHFGFEHAEVDYFDAKLGVERTIAYLERTRTQRSFVWLHLLEPHEPYEQHPSYFFGHSDRDRYDSEIGFADAQVGLLLDYLERTRPGAAIIVTADHGEAFDEHGARYHGTSLYDEQLRVPLILRLPGQGPRVIRTPISLLDVTPTLLQLAEVTVPAELRGQALLPLSDANLAPRHIFAELDELRMVVAGTRKLLCDILKGSCAVHDLARDPKEQTDIAQSSQETVSALQPELSRRINEAAASYAQKMDPKEPRWSLIGRAQLGDRSVGAELSNLLQAAVPQQLRRAAARWLAELPVPPSATAVVQAALRDADVELSGWAAVAGAALRLPDARAASRRLLARATTPAALRSTLALVMGEQGDATALPVLLELLPKCTEPARCQRMVKVIGKLHDARAVPALLAALPRLDVRREVVDALGAIADPSSLQPLIDALLSDTYVPVRAAAAQALGQLRDPAAREALEQAASQDTETRVVNEARRAVSRLRPK